MPYDYPYVIIIRHKKGEDTYQVAKTYEGAKKKASFAREHGHTAIIKKDKNAVWTADLICPRCGWSRPGATTPTKKGITNYSIAVAGDYVCPHCDYPNVPLRVKSHLRMHP